MRYMKSTSLLLLVLIGYVLAAPQGFGGGSGGSQGGFGGGQGRGRGEGLGGGQGGGRGGGLGGGQQGGFGGGQQGGFGRTTGRLRWRTWTPLGLFDLGGLHDIELEYLAIFAQEK
ncbi:hypothetical protein JTB14_038443 [Gonioctena quinquepunctata]|nr:hypothetical protein JTB14_038443 [Gonioctena quinquepunctata]